MSRLQTALGLLTRPILVANISPVAQNKWMQHSIMRTFMSRVWLANEPATNSPTSTHSTQLLQPAALGIQQVRTKVRQHYKPNAYKRWRKHGKESRINSRNKLKILWRRFLKGRHTLWH